MVEYNIKRIIYAAVIVFLFSFVILYLGINQLFLRPKGIWELITTSISFTAICACFFVKIAWKWGIFRGWLVPFPNLNGRWKGSISYLEDGEIKKRKVEVDIKQTFLSIIVNFCTRESKSISFCGSFNIDEKREVRQLIYSYQNNPDTNLRDRSPLHFGTTKLDISANNKHLSGEYWTSRRTTGTIELIKEEIKR